MAELVRALAGFPFQEVVRLNYLEPQSSQAMTCQVYTCHHLAWRSVLTGYGNNWFTQCQGNVTD